MPSPALTPEITAHLASIRERFPAIEAIWLYGSRANGTARVDSDWDFLVFGNQEVLLALRTDTAFQRDDVDLLIVTDGNHFTCPWPRPHPFAIVQGVTPYKSGQLFTGPAICDELEIERPGLQWVEETERLAAYIGTKRGEEKSLHALRVFPA